MPPACRCSRAVRLALAFAVAGAVALDAQTEAGRLPSWQVGPEEYGAHPQNWDVAFSRAGFVAVANTHGVLLYDGAQWELLPSPNGGIVRAVEFVGERLFLGAQNELGYYEPDAAGRLEYRSLTEHIPEGVELGDIFGMAADGARVVFQSRSALVVVPIEGDIPGTPRVIEGRFFGVHRVDGELLALGGAALISRLRDAGRESVLESVDVEMSPELQAAGPLGRPGAIVAWPGQASSDADRLVLTERRLLRWRQGELTPLRTDAEQALAESWLYTAQPLPNGDLAIGTIRGGIFVLDSLGRLRRRIATEMPVLALALDRDGGLWAGLDGGVTRIEIGSALAWFDKDEGLRGTVEDVARFQGRLWACTNIGAFRFEAAAEPGRIGSWTLVHPDQCWTLGATEESLLAGTQNGLFSVAPEAGQRLAAGPVRDLRRSRRDPDLIWAARIGSLLELRREGRAWRESRTVPGVVGRLQQVLEDSDGSLWLGTRFEGVLHVLDPHSEAPAVEHYGAEQGLPGEGDRYAVPFSVAGRLVFGTQSGLLELDSAERRFGPSDLLGEPFTTGGAAVFRLAEDRDGNVWIRSSGVTGVAWREAGSYRWDPTPLALLGRRGVRHLSAEDGETLWIGVVGGLARVAIRDVAPPAGEERGGALPVVVSSVRVLGDEEPFWRSFGLGVEAPIELPAHSGTVRFRFGAAGFAAPERTEYSARLEGVDRDWSAWSTESFRDYAGLPGGRHRFTVRARDALGRTGSSRVVSLRVAWPWYATPLARVGWTVLALATVLLVSTGAATWRSRALARRARELEEQVRERTRRLQRQARRLEAQARTIAEQEAAKSRFFANLTHDLRTPLTLTIGPLEDVERGLHGELRDDAREQIGLALRHNRRLLQLIEQLLDVARAESGALRLRPRTGDLAVLVREVAELFRSRAESKRIELAVETPSSPLETTFDSDEIEKVLFNLLSNALKFTPPGGRVEVGLAEDAAGDRVVEVRDTGPGIAAGDRSRIFEPYYQGSVGLDGSHPGVGLGLALSREIAEAHGGRLEVESEVGAGATLRLVLAAGCEQFTTEQLRSGGRLERPSGGFGAALMARLESERAPKSEGASEETPAIGLSPQDTPTVIVVDDHPEMRRYVRKHLEDGYRVLEAGDGRSALELARAEIPDLIVSDVMMPDMDGLELCREVRSDSEIDFVPIILLTARSTPADAVEGLQGGADDYVAKPFDAQELRARVDGLIASRRHLQARFGGGEPVPISGLTAEDREFVERLYAVLEERLDDETFRVPALARALAMERSTLYRRCQRVLESTPTEAIRNHRLDRAATLLREDAGTVSEIAYAVGFASLSYFAKTFRERFGASPSEYRSVRRRAANAYESPP